MAMIGPEKRATLSTPLDNEGSGAPIGAGVENCTCYQIQPRSVLRDRSPLGAPLCGLPRLSSQPGPGQRFLELPDANGSGLSAHRLSGASAASTWQSEHMPDGHDAQAALEQK